jgi:hypothetical protein
MIARKRTVWISLALVLGLLLSLAPVSLAGSSEGGPARSFTDPMLQIGRSMAAQQQGEAAAQRSPDSSPQMTIIATGLNNPRGMAFAPNGDLYVAEAGVGGPDCYEVDPGQPPLCIGNTGSVTRIRQGVQERVATGLVSLGDPSGFGSVGPTSLSFTPRGNATVLVGLGADPAFRDQLASDYNLMFANLGHSVRMSPSGYWNTEVDVSAYEGSNNPDGGEVDSNPYGVLFDRNKNFIADAGGNDLVQIDSNGNLSTVAVFPDQLVPVPPFLGGGMIPMQAVPTAVVKGPDGALYVSILTGFPFPAGGAKVYRVIPGSNPAVYADGFTALVDLTFDSSGNMYVVEFAQDLLACESQGICQGRVIRVAPDGTRTVLASNLNAPGGVAVSRNGEVYATTFSIFPGGGQVVRLVP